DGSISYEVYNGAADMAGEPVIHGNGRAVPEAPGPRPQLDLEGLQRRCHERMVRADEAYQAFHAVGLDYGPAYRGLESLAIGKDNAGRPEVLARLTLPDCVAGTQGDYILHPAMMDAALQAVAGLTLEEEQGGVYLPFAVETVRMWSASPAQGWAWARFSAGSSAGAATRKFDIDLCDADGFVCVRLTGFNVRALEGGEAEAHELVDASETGLFLLAPVWDVTSPVQEAVSPAPGERTVIIGGTEERRAALIEHLPNAQVLKMPANASVEDLQRQLGAAGQIDHMIWLAPEEQAPSFADDALIAAQEDGVLHCFRLFKALAALGYCQQSLSWTLITAQTQAVRRCDAQHPAHASLHGFMGSLAKEYPHWRVRLADLPVDGDWPLAALLRLPPDAEGAAWAWRDGEWYRQQLLPGLLPDADETLYRRGGVYVVIGGAGGIGEVWSEHMIRRYGAQIVWIGRRAPDDAIEAKLERLSYPGPAPQYLSADAGSREALQTACDTIRERFGVIHGVVHSAIVLADKSLEQMSEAVFRSALAAKVDVSVRLAQVFGEEPLDFVLFFSSVQSFMPAAGQSNYAAGCTFKDAFAQTCGRHWSCPVKIMNWGYWGSIGVVAADDYRERLAASGIGSIEPSEGMAALDVLMASPCSQLGLLKTLGVANTAEERRERLSIQMAGAVPVMGALRSNTEMPVLAVDSASNPELGTHESILARLLRAQLISMGVEEARAESFEEIKTRLGINDFYSRWLAASLAMLVQKELLQSQDGRYQAGPGAASDALAVLQEWQAGLERWQDVPEMEALVRLEAETMRGLPEILTGRVSAVDVVFPDGSMELVESVYKNNAVADYFNDCVAGIVEAYVKARVAQDADARIRILEIGAGTGGTSAGVFAKLKPYAPQIAEYCYTDLSQAFLMHAQQVYASEAPYLNTRILDIEKPLAAQGFEIGDYDLVIAANVLHTAGNIRHCLRNAKAALRRHGVLVLNELTSESLSMHVTFGLLEGWWAYNDEPLRIPGTPALAPETWARVLEEEGFGHDLLPAAAARHPKAANAVRAAETERRTCHLSQYACVKPSQWQFHHWRYSRSGSNKRIARTEDGGARHKRRSGFF
ncbi:MAG: SDR family NAD(P)-dependent oxidoreductase, partial [Alphaproteobacteria bacterium]